MALKFAKISSEVDDEYSDSSSYKIHSFPADFTLKGLHDKFLNGEILTPSFQRQYVWTIQQASKLIESFLLGLPVPGVFFYREEKSQKLLVVDGQQRLKTVFGFFDQKFPGTERKFFLRDVRESWEGRTYDKLGESDQIRLKDSVLRAMIIEQIDPDDHSSMFHIFERLNTGGTVLRPQEIRNCIYQGSLNDLLRELNEDRTWRRIVGSVNLDKRMRDVELILRFLALLHDYQNYKKPMKDFISEFIARNRNAESDKVAQFRKIFTTTNEAINKHLGQKPFHIKAGLNAAVFDSVMIAFARNENRHSVIRDMPKRYKQLLEDDAYQNYVSTATTDVDTVKGRIALASRLLFR